MDNMELWNKYNRPPQSALKAIKGGRMSGKTDINPQWRLQALTEMFGPCGTGWWYDVEDVQYKSCGEEIAVLVTIKLWYSACKGPVTGVGGSMLRVEERNGLRTNDEALKMATTDAISVACKQLGIAADIYLGLYDGSKYREDAPNPQAKPKVDSLVQAKAELLNAAISYTGKERADAIKWTQAAIKAVLGRELANVDDVDTVMVHINNAQLNTETADVLPV